MGRGRHGFRREFILVFIFLINTVASGSIVDKAIPELLRNYTTPTILVDPANHPNFIDDLDFENLDIAIDRQLKRYASKNLSGYIAMGRNKYPQTWALASLEQLKVLVEGTQDCLSRVARKAARTHCYKILKSEIKNKFDVYKPNLAPGDPRYGGPNTTFFTGYYTPTLKGSSVKTAEYPWPVYMRPRRSSEVSKTREEIDFEGAFVGKGYELFYTKDLFEIYLLQVEGGGKVAFDRKSSQSPDDFYLSYAGTNGQSWNFISKYMKRAGMISSMSIAAQRRYLKKHPEKAREIYSTCPSYVYFKESKEQPEGSDVVSLTNRRSIATDSRLYGFKGLIAFVETQRAEERNNYDLDEEEEKLIRFKSFSRFYLDQDTGGAIRGKGRVDIFFGESEYAAFAASNQKTFGNLYFLILKK